MGASGASHTSGAVVQRRVGGITAACVLISNVIGSGIFTTTGFMARDLGDPGLILLLWLIGALLALAGATVSRAALSAGAAPLRCGFGVDRDIHRDRATH